MSNCEPTPGNASRRLYFRRKQREYRDRVKNERAVLHEVIARLQQEVSKQGPAKLLSEDGMLSWQLVASAFQETSRNSKDKHAHLQALVDANSALIYDMTRFLRACQPRPTAAITFEQPVHRHVTLVAQQEARVQAKQWLVQQLYHNTDRAFSDFPALDNYDVFVEAKSKCSGRWVNTVETCQVVWPYSLEVIKQVFLLPQSQNILCNADNFAVERDGNTILARGLYDEKYPWHTLRGHFHEADRFVAVQRSLNHDEAFEDLDDLNYHDMEWIDVRRLSPTQCVVRTLGHRTMLIDHAIGFAEDMGIVTLRHDEKTSSRMCRSLASNLSAGFSKE
ncbi:hypothetical protein LEN26_019498 [Aphanomyces euteiches]|nr:hypothetical protein LEN26_019498 [Aphanomyces euteiches]